jgi:hypothetical protein
MKVCGRCKEEKQFDQFGKKGNGYQSYCVRCRRIKQKEWVEANPERMQRRRDRAKQWAKDNPEKKRKHGLDWKKRNIESVREKGFAYHIEKTYGLSVDEYNKILENQNALCAICKENKKLWIDHNHSTGTVRGLLCPSCNSLIGYLETYEHLLTKAVQYLKKFE